MKNKIVKDDYIGKKYNFLTIIDVDMTNYIHNTTCKCDCGNIWVGPLNQIKRGKTKSCGCYLLQRIKEANTKHASSQNGDPTYSSWLNMRGRCNIKTTPDYKHYGGRGITICDRWDDYKNFLEDMGEKPEGLTLDRIDNDGNYCKENCKWSTRKEQGRNRRNIINYFFRGNEVPLYKLSDISGLSQSTIKNRIKNLNWTVEDAVTTPLLIIHKSKK